MPAPASAVTLQITCFRSGTEGVLRELPGRLLVAKWGDTASSRGVVRVNEVTASRLPALQAVRKFDRVAIDFQHNTLDAKSPDPKKVAGFGTPRVIAGEGLWLEDIEWTPEGRELLPAGHYPDISPAVERMADGTVIFLHSAGAVRQGELDGLTLFSATLSPPSQPDTDPETNTMENAALSALRKLLAIIGITLPETTTAEGIAAAEGEATEKLTAMSAPAKPETKPEPAASAEGFSTALKPFVDRLDKFEADRHADAINGLLGAATAAGKVVPFSATMALKFTTEELKDALDKLPGGEVPGNGTRHDVEAFSAHGKGGLHAESLHALKTAGYSDEEIKAATGTK